MATVINNGNIFVFDNSLSNECHNKGEIVSCFQIINLFGQNMARFHLKDSDEFYLALSEQPKRFDADSPVTNVFFDDTNGQVIVLIYFILSTVGLHLYHEVTN